MSALEVAYYGIRAWLFVKSTIASICGCRESKKLQSNIESPPSSTRIHYPLFTIETFTFLNGDKKHAVLPPGEKAKSYKDCNRSNIRPPWFFIGYYDSAKSLQDKTSEMDDYIYPGNLITNDLLQHLYPGAKRWVYIHPETFEEMEFPSDGIVIQEGNANSRE
jgi:hypothetical protein